MWFHMDCARLMILHCFYLIKHGLVCVCQNFRGILMEGQELGKLERASSILSPGRMAEIEKSIKGPSTAREQKHKMLGGRGREGLLQGVSEGKCLQASPGQQSCSLTFGLSSSIPEALSDPLSSGQRTCLHWEGSSLQAPSVSWKRHEQGVLLSFGYVDTRGHNQHGARPRGALKCLGNG